MKNFLHNKNVAVLGLARSGVASANLAKRRGANVLISDNGSKLNLRKFKLLKGIKTEFGQHSKRILRSDLIIKSPGVPNDIKILIKAREKNIPVWGEIELASKFINPHKIYAITGTNGKTTTTSLLGEIIKKSGQETIVGGNIGMPLAAITEDINKKTNIILEVSSYQLEDSRSFHPKICAILNITPDHLEHHHSMKSYIEAKEMIFANQNKTDVCILNYDDNICRKIARKCPSRVIYFSRKKCLKTGVYYRDGKITVNIGKNKYDIPNNFKILGMHNIENIMAAVAMAAAGGIEKAAIVNALYEFPGVEHRIEFVKEINGVKYYNDSKGTNVDSTRVALEAFKKGIWLILGGRDKGSSYKPLSKLVKRKVKGILLIGEASRKIKNELNGISVFYNCQNLKRAVKKARELAVPGDIVLLSPACASFDQFRDFEDRGTKFKAFVKKII